MTETLKNQYDKKIDAICEQSKARKKADPSYLRFVTAKSGPGMDAVLMQNVTDLRAGLAVEEAIAPLVKRIELLEAELKDARELKYMGTWRNNAIFNKGNFTTHAGSLWIAETTTDAKPGTADSGWKMVAKGSR